MIEYHRCRREAPRQSGYSLPRRFRCIACNRISGTHLGTVTISLSGIVWYDLGLLRSFPAGQCALELDESDGL